MGKKIDTSLVVENDKVSKRVIRMAYSLNNTQPVQCTMVSDQPFFYIDEEMDEEDDFFLSEDLSLEEILSEAEIDDPALIDELLSMKEKIDAYEPIAAMHIKDDKEALRSFKDNAKNFGAQAADGEVLEDVMVLMSKSRMASALLEFAQSQNIEFKINGEAQNAVYDKNVKTIFVNPQLGLSDMALLCVRELRRAWQQGQGANINPLAFSPDEAVVVHRAQKADLDGAIVRFAWECRLSGESSIWASLEKSEYQDLARGFAREALADFRTLNNGRASAVLFETWFLSERCTASDKDLINLMLSEYKDYQPEDNGHNTFDILCRLGEMPFGKNYLSGYAHMIVEDSLFTEVRDRSSANFLWFIKFERDFDRAEKIAEQQLQSPNTSKTSDGVHDLTNKQDIFEDTNNDKIHAFPHQRARSGITAGNKSAGYSNNIIPLFVGADCGSNRSHT